jgi:rSAM/selenodomain-associated transferase 1
VSRTALLVFAKAPLPGQVKTRLLSVLTPAAAARLQGTLVRRTLAKVQAVPGTRRHLCCAPDCSHPLLRRSAADFGARLQPQRGGDLGARMAHAFAWALRRAPAAVLLGCDCPDLSPALLQQACAALQRHAAVLGPALDGGYVLIGLTRPQPALFRAMPWGSDRVLELTRRRLDQAGLSRYELPPLGDLDRPADLDRYPDLDPRLTGGAAT